jgi:hypothetical protein
MQAADTLFEKHTSAMERKPSPGMPTCLLGKPDLFMVFIVVYFSVS